MHLSWITLGSKKDRRLKDWNLLCWKRSLGVLVDNKLKISSVAWCQWRLAASWALLTRVQPVDQRKWLFPCSWSLLGHIQDIVFTFVLLQKGGYLWNWASPVENCQDGQGLKHTCTMKRSWGNWVFSGWRRKSVRGI